MRKTIAIFSTITLLAFIFIGYAQSWQVSLSILIICLISAIMALGINIQWGYAGLFSVGTVGFVAVGGLAVVLVSQAPVQAAWQAGGANLLYSALILASTIVMAICSFKYLQKGWVRRLVMALIILIGYFFSRWLFVDATNAIESIDPSVTGYIGGMDLPVILSWIIGGLFAAAIAWFIGRITLKIESDYLAIATLGIGYIVVTVLKNEDWLSRGVKNVTGLTRPVPYELDLVNQAWFQSWSGFWGTAPADAAGIFVKLCYVALSLIVLAIIMYFAEKSWHSPWGRMMRAIRDNPKAAQAMGKDITKRKLQTFVLGSAVIGIAGAMLTTVEGQFTPGVYTPLRHTFILWVMVVIGGSGNNWGTIFGSFLVWFAWIEAEPMAIFLIEILTIFMAPDNAIREHFINNAAYMRLILIGLVLLIVMRFYPNGLMPEFISKKSSLSNK